MVTEAGSAAESVTVTVTLSPAFTGLRGETDRSTAGLSSSMVRATEVVAPAAMVDGRFAVSTATVNVSSSMSSSWRGPGARPTCRQAVPVSQVSTDRSGTRRNSERLWVTSGTSRDRACAAIHRSLGPIGRPMDRR